MAGNYTTHDTELQLMLTLQLPPPPPCHNERKYNKKYIEVSDKEKCVTTEIMYIDKLLYVFLVYNIYKTCHIQLGVKIKVVISNYRAFAL